MIEISGVFTITAMVIRTKNPASRKVAVIVRVVLLLMVNGVENGKPL